MLLTERARPSLALCLAVLLVLSGCASSPEKGVEYGAVTSHPLATQAALRILDNGGTAADAAVAASAVLSVVQPTRAPMGGGQLWLVSRPGQPPVYLDALPALPDDLFSALPKAVQPAIPGTWAGWEALTSQYGQLPRSTVYQDALKLAEKGIPGQGPRPALARFFKALQIRGRAGLYEGPFADALRQTVIETGGYWNEQELNRYRVRRHTPEPLNMEGLAGTWYVPPPSVSLAGVDLATTHALMRAIPEALPLSARLALVTHFQADVWPASPLSATLHASLPVSNDRLAPHLDALKDWLQAPPPRPDRAPRALPDCSHTAAGLVVQDRQGLRIAATFWTPSPGMTPLRTGDLGLTLFDIAEEARPLVEWLTDHSHLPANSAPLLREFDTETALLTASHSQNTGPLVWTLARTWAAGQPLRIWQSRPTLCTAPGRWVQAPPPVQALSAQLAPAGMGVLAAPVRTEVNGLLHHPRKLRLQPFTEDPQAQGRAITRMLAR